MKCFIIYSRLFIPIFFFLLCACEKEDPKPPAGINEAPEITVTSPPGHNQYTTGQSIQVVANVKDNKEIYEVFVQLKNLSDNTILSIFSVHVHQTNYDLHTSYTVGSYTPPGDYSLIIKATDLDNNVSEKTVPVTIN